jgi:hypothetical protein
MNSRRLMRVLQDVDWFKPLHKCKNFIMARETTCVCERSSIVALLLLASSVVFAQSSPPPQPAAPVQNESQRLIQAVREGNEAAVFELIKTSAGRQELLALSDTYVFEIRVAKLLRSSLPESPEDRKAVRQMELSLLRQTSDESVVNELFVGLLAREPKDVTNAAEAIKLADALYGDIEKDLYDEVTREGKVVRGGKSRVMVETAESIVKTVTDPAQVAFFRRILTRVRDDPDQSAATPSTLEQVPKPSLSNAPSAASVFWRKILTGAAALLLAMLVVAIGWRITRFRPRPYVEPDQPAKKAVTVPADPPELDQDENSQP